MLIANRDQVIAFRLEGQHLNRRLPAGSLLAAAGACGMQNTPPGSAELALHARVGGLAPGDVERALVADRSLLQLWSLRASPYIFPTGDAAAFTRGLAPVAEDEIRRFIFAVEPALDRIGISARRVVELAAEGLEEILAGRALTKDELGIQIARWMSPRLEPGQASGWQSASWYAPGQSLGESVVRFALPVLALQGRFCHAERQGSQAFFRLTREWLGSPLPDEAAEPGPGRTGPALPGLLRTFDGSSLRGMGGHSPRPGRPGLAAGGAGAGRDPVWRPESLSPGGMTCRASNPRPRPAGSASCRLTTRTWRCATGRRWSRTRPSSGRCG